MVTEERLHASAGGRARRGTLTKKLFRDMRRSGMQFLAMLLLCALGTWVFSGLDATWRMIELSVEKYYTEYNLSDFWVKGSSFSKQDLLRLQNLDGVETAIARTSLEFDCPDWDGVSVMVNAYDGDMTVNKPYLLEGELLESNDLRGLLLENQFAAAHGLSVGDTLTITVNGTDMTFTIRGLVLSPEYLITSKDVAPNANLYGFALMNHQALGELPLNEIIIRLKDGADSDAVHAAIEEELPAALVVTQATHASTATCRSYESMFRSLSYLFPALAYAVAAMIVVSTLQRMIENQRIQMGTLKALGYPTRKIRRHYLSYALVPSLAGSLIGLYTGRITLPYVVWRMCTNNMRPPWCLQAPISALSWGAAVLTVALSLLICLYSFAKANRETTASLLRPKPPKSGTRILLERVTFLWNRFSFNTKMIVRNLMRNKGRTMMTLVGMLCCNMLIVCSFSLQDSIPFMIRRYYQGTLGYDVRVDLDTTQSGTLESYQKRLDAEQVEGIMEISINLRSPTNSRACLVTVIPDGQTLIRLNIDNTVLTLPEEGVCLSRKLAKLMNVSVGDTVEIVIPGDDEILTQTVMCMADTNVAQGVFMSQTAWERCRKGGFSVTSLLLKGPSDACIRELEDEDEFSALKYPTEQYTQSMHIMDSASTAFSVLSGAALGLAFVICYNMGLMSFTERTRDYATLKVLGYHQREIRHLMLRENNILAILGTGLGVYPGVLLTKIILQMCEYDSMVFQTTFTAKSLILASVITFAFSWFIEWLLTRKVRGIDMVEALKSVE